MWTDLGMKCIGREISYKVTNVTPLLTFVMSRAEICRFGANFGVLTGFFDEHGGHKVERLLVFYATGKLFSVTARSAVTCVTD